MRRNYSIARAGLIALLVLLSGPAAADPCPAGLRDVAAQVGALRAAGAGFGPPCRVISRAALTPELDRKLRRDLPIAPELYLEALVRLGVIDGEPERIYPRLLDFYSSQVLGFYEPATDQMVIVGDPAADVGTELVWAHELAHAVQEKRFRLPSRLLAMAHDSDAQRAASAVAEGEAMLVMFIAVAGEQALAGVEQVMAAQAASLRAPPGVPDFFLADLLFPYREGFSTVLRAYRTGGWPAVDALLVDPPGSTAELLDPTRKAPGPVPASALPAVPEGWEEVLTDPVGEWTLGFWLGRRIGVERAQAVAAAWNGDRLRLIRSRADRSRWALAWRLRCASEQGCAALRAALEANLPALLDDLAGEGRTADLLWTIGGGTIEVRAAWPAATSRRPAASRR